MEQALQCVAESHAALVHVVIRAYSFMIFLEMVVFILEFCHRPHSQKFGAVEPGRVGG